MTLTFHTSLKILRLFQVPGISHAHQATVLDGQLYLRKVSCYRPCCLRTEQEDFLPTCRDREAGWFYDKIVPPKKPVNPAYSYEITDDDVAFADTHRPRIGYDLPGSDSESDCESDADSVDSDADYEPPRKRQAKNLASDEDLEGIRKRLNRRRY